MDEAAIAAFGQRIEVAPEEGARPVAQVAGRPIAYRELLPALRRFARGRTGGHMLGAGVKLKVLGTLIDDRLLAAEARAEGVDCDPAVRRELARAELHALAMALAERLRAAAPPAASPADRERAVRDALEELRDRTKIDVKKKAARAAAAAGIR